MKLRNFLALSIVALVAPISEASILYTGSSITENFDGMPSSGTSTGFFVLPAGTATAITGAGGWDGTKASGTGTTGMNFVADNGGANSGAIYSYGTTGAAERALGSVASGTNQAAFGVQIVNGTSDTITEITVSFTQENWRSSTNQVNTTAASYSTTDAIGPIGVSYLNSGVFAAATVLDLVGPAPVTTNGPLDGNLSANQVARLMTITGLSIDPNESFYLRFTDTDNPGSDAGLAIDDVRFDFVTNAVPEPATLALAAFGLIGMITFRRN